MGAKKKRLEAAVAAIQMRWGTKALRQGVQVTPVSAMMTHIPTGFSALDGALAGIGGIPRNRITELLGTPTSGMVTLALKIIAQAQSQGDTAVYVDLATTFDPDYAARCEVDLSHLLVIRPANAVKALEIIHTLVAQRSTGIIVFANVSSLFFNHPSPSALSAALRQIPAALAPSNCALLFLTPLQINSPMSRDNYPNGFALPHFASVRLHLKKEKWLQKRNDVRGYQAQVKVLKNKLGPAGRSAKISITFNGVVRGDGT